MTRQRQTRKCCSVTRSFFYRPRSAAGGVLRALLCFACLIMMRGGHHVESLIGRQLLAAGVQRDVGVVRTHSRVVERAEWRELFVIGFLSLFGAQQLRAVSVSACTNLVADQLLCCCSLLSLLVCCRCCRSCAPAPPPPPPGVLSVRPACQLRVLLPWRSLWQRHKRHWRVRSSGRHRQLRHPESRCVSAHTCVSRTLRLINGDSKFTSRLTPQCSTSSSFCVVALCLWQHLPWKDSQALIWQTMSRHA